MKHTKLMARVVAATAALSTAAAGAIVLVGATSPAQGALRETKYGFRTYAYGTNAKAELVGLASAPTALSHVSCTRFAGKREVEALAAVGNPATAGLFDVGAVRSVSETFKKNGRTGSRSTSRVADVVIGDREGVNIAIKGLAVSAEAWANKKGDFKRAGSFDSVSISANTGIDAIDDVLNTLGATVGDLVKLILQAPGNQLEIPGLALIKLGKLGGKITKSQARQNSTALRVRIYGVDGVKGGGDDINLAIGKATAIIYRDLPAGVMGGQAFAAQASVLDGLVGTGKVGRVLLPCEGTKGKIEKGAVAGVNLGNAGLVQVDAAGGRVFGRQKKKGAATAWTEGRVANVELGEGDSKLQIQGIVGRATVKRNRKGKITTSSNGTKLASISVGAEQFELPDLGETLEIPGVARISFGVEEKGNRKNALRVIAVRIVLLEALAEDTGLVKVDLGVADTFLKRR